MKYFPTALVVLLSFSVFLAGGVTGKWDFTAKSSDGQTYDLILVLEEIDGKLTGTLGNWEGDVPLDKVKMTGGKLTFELSTPDMITYSTVITVKGESMEGTYKGDDGSSGTIVAKLAKAD
jgi:hypothetical protein